MRARIEGLNRRLRHPIGFVQRYLACVVFGTPSLRDIWPIEQSPGPVSIAKVSEPSIVSSPSETVVARYGWDEYRLCGMWHLSRCAGIEVV